jgi:Poxvirus A32 protein
MEVKTSVEDKIKSTGTISVPVWDPKDYFDRNLKKWNSFTCVIYGARMSGKSNMLKHILTGKECGKLADKFNTIVVFSKTVINGYYHGFLKKALMFDKFSDGPIETFKKYYANQKKQGKRYRWLVIFDDCMSNKQKYEEGISDIFTNGRHHGCSIVFLAQKATFVESTWKANTMLNIILKSGTFKEKKYLSENIIMDSMRPLLPETMTETKLRDQGLRLQDTLCKNYNAIVTTPFEDDVQLMQYKAALHR